MANIFDPKYSYLAGLGVASRRNTLLDLVEPPTTTPGISPTTQTLASLLSASPPAPPTNPFLPTRPLFNTFLGSIESPAPTPRPAAPLYAPPKPKHIAQETIRRAFFSFQFDGDIMRVNAVRNAWKIDHPDSATNRSFRDSSLWEARKLESPEAIKNLIRSGVLYTSAVCVLAGSMTWDRRWVRYEIARAIIDDRGLLTVHLNNIRHHRTKAVHPRGRNPLAHMGIAKVQRHANMPPQYFLYEMSFAPDGIGGLVENWTPYSDYTASVKKPAWLTDPAVGYVMPLSNNASEYDYVLDHGHRNIGSWIDKAAKQAGR
ncbi:hypothetical protein V1294_005450 [Bradyrhizobium sp. AZCC 1678]|uniref:TIR domain-containing protein n=1 Tax=Bradyrhizobium sp. AZCC 1678 TaxID=3117030 RepID=UPI002FF29D44